MENEEPEEYSPVDSDQEFPPRSPIAILEYSVPFSEYRYQGPTEFVVNHARLRFDSDMEVPQWMAQQAAKLNPLAIPLREVCLTEMEDVIRCVFESALQNCSRGYRVHSVLIKSILKNLKELVRHLPRDDGNDEMMVLRMMPVVLLNRPTGVLMAYALGQVLAPASNISKKRMLVKGYVMNATVQEILIKSSTISLLCGVGI